jgi:hypothetical protein
MKVFNKRVMKPGSKKKARVLTAALAILLCIVVTNVPTASAYPGKASSFIDVHVYDAYYGDLDSEGIENDVHIILLFDLGYNQYYEFYYQITLTLPSGVSYSYLVHVLAWYEYIRIDNEFLNYATEKGNYRVDVTALMVYPVYYTDSGSIVFDPPGYGAGADPEFRVY